MSESAGPKTVAEAKAMGNAALKEDRLDDAIALFTEGIKLAGQDKTGVEVLYGNRAAVFMRKGDYKSALGDAEMSIRINPQWPRGYSRKAAALHALHEYDEAAVAYKEAIKLDPENATLRENLEEMNRERHEEDMMYDDSEEKFEMPEMPKFFDKIFGPEMMDRLAQFPETAKLLEDPSFRKAMLDMQEHPETREMHLQDPKIMMAVQLLMGFDPHIRDILARVQAVNERKEMEAENAKREEAKKKEEEKKKKEHEEALAKRPPAQVEADEEKEKGNVAYRAKDFDTAIACYKKASEIYPDDATYISNLASAYMGKGDYDACIAACKEGTEKAQKFAQYGLVPKLLTRMGKAYMKKEDYGSAIEAFKKSLLEERTADTQERLREAERLKREADARAYIDPAKAAEAKQRGNEFFKTARYPEAVKEYTEAIKRSPTDPVMYSNRAAAYMKLMEYPHALKDCEKAIELDPHFIRGYTRKGACHYFMKEYHKAAEAYSRGLDIDPNNQECKDGLASVEAAVNAQQQTGADREQLERAMADPEIRAILQDPIINSVLEDFKTDPIGAQRHLQNPEIMEKIQKLVNSGLLRATKTPVNPGAAGM